MIRKIKVIGTDSVVQFAARELARYAKKITGKRPTVQRAADYRPGTAEVWLGICTDFTHEESLQIKAHPWDDGFVLRGDGRKLIIGGTNGRSVLFGVYAYLERLGARWIRPWRDGEWLPSMEELPIEDMHAIERASYRHRGICIEGAPSIEHALGMIDWLAKRRMNTFFLQFQHSGYFWNQWYNRQNPYVGAPRRLSTEECYALDDRVIQAAQQRGLVVHRVGHGWTAESIGLDGVGWEPTLDVQLTEEQRRRLAEVNGVRDLWHNVAINTELCYSYGPAFEGIVSTAAEYAAQHPEVDVLHFWLSDASNNQCECAECRKLSPVDWYARLINALSERLHAIDPKKRFVFLSYLESWWPPEREVIGTRYGNAIMMFAPIARCFRHHLTDNQCDGKPVLERPPLNQVKAPRENRTYTALCGLWRNQYDGDSFLFDYYMWSAIHEEMLDTRLARVIHQDMRDLKPLGLNGFVSCQALRSFWPTGLPMAAMADTTWNRRIPWKQVQDRHLKAAFGRQAKHVSQYLKELEEHMLPAADHDVVATLRSGDTRQLQPLARFLKDYRPQIYEWARSVTLPVHRKSFRLLLHHNRLLQSICRVRLAEVKGNKEQAKGLAEQTKTWLLRSERWVHPVLDLYLLFRRQFADGS